MVYSSHMKKLICNDISGQDCPYVAEGETDEVVGEKLLEHGASTHPEMMSSLTPEENAVMEKKIEERLAEQS